MRNTRHRRFVQSRQLNQQRVFHMLNRGDSNPSSIQASTTTNQPQQQVADLNQNNIQVTTSSESQRSTRVMQFQ